MRAWPVLHRLGPLFLGSLRFNAMPSVAATLRAVELLRSIYESGGRKWPQSLPTSFLRPAWRDAVLNTDGAERRTWEAATLLALRDRLRAGDIWIEGSRQWRAIEDQLIPPALFAAMREILASHKGLLRVLLLRLKVPFRHPARRIASGCPELAPL